MDTIETSERLMKIFESSSKNCNCHWPNPLFSEILREYTYLRIQIHRARKLHDRVPYDLINRVTIARHRLATVAPCQDCIEKYNPTGRRISKIWNPNRNRAFKECLR